MTWGYVACVTDALDPYSGIAKYLQIRDILVAEIRAGIYAPGSPIPGRATLEQRFEAAGETVRRATAELARLGYVVNSPGVGLIVTPPDRWPKAG